MTPTGAVKTRMLVGEVIPSVPNITSKRALFLVALPKKERPKEPFGDGSTWEDSTRSLGGPCWEKFESASLLQVV